jgi:succinate dehydrogenase / fumarate reductase flavoprotein subunit
MSAEWRKVNLIVSLAGEKVELHHKPAPPIPVELLGLFELSELKKYMTDEELAVLPASAGPSAGPSPEAKPESGAEPKEGN